MLVLASDFDSTLYFMDGGFRREDLAAVEHFQRGGNLFGLCTGRSTRGITDVVQDRIPFDFYILESGSLILDKDLTEIYARRMPWTMAETLLEEFIFPKNYLYVVHADDTVYGVPAHYDDGTSIEALEDLDPDKVYQVSMALEDYEAAREAARAINRKYGHLVTAFQNKRYLDIISAGCSKGRGIDFLRERYRPEVMAGIGDSYNDLSMLQAADVSFTMSASPEDVKDAADHVVGSVAEAIAMLETGLARP